jgi:hypothetical protein
LQLGRIRVGRDGDAVGHGAAQKEWFQVSPATVPIELDARMTWWTCLIGSWVRFPLPMR